MFNNDRDVDMSEPIWVSKPYSSSNTDPEVFEDDSEGMKSDSDDGPKGKDNRDEGNVPI